jgi:hypothetical protein
MKRLISARILCLVLLPLVFTLTACDSGGSGSDIDNQFTLTISSSSSSSTAAVPKETKKDLNGWSFFVDTEDVEEVDEQSFVVYFNDSESFSQQNATQGLFGFVAQRSSQPGTGDYTISDQSSSSNFVAWLYEDLDNTQSAPFYLIHDGTVSFETSTDNKVVGTLSGKATEFEFTSTDMSLDTVDVSGSFTAKNLDEFVDFSNYTDAPAP